MNIDPSHHIKGIRPALQIMNELGFDAEVCLEETGITLQQLDSLESGISIDQEFRFYRHLLSLTDDPTLGLKLGNGFRLESYGVFGYAILSADTLRDGLELTAKYGALSFSWFEFSVIEKNGLAHLQMSQRSQLPKDLLQVYEDRDCSAIVGGTVSALGQMIPLKEVRLMHDVTPDQKAVYQAMFNCPIKYAQAQMELIFDASVLDQKMPLRDPATAIYCRQQCEIQMRKLTQSYSWADRVRQVLRDSMFEICSSALMAEHLNISERSLRRKLSQESVSFKTLLIEERKTKAETLLKADVKLEDLASQLGYSEAANFSHAFKGWFGMSPSAYRKK